MRHGRRMNVPNVLYHLLAIMVVKMQKGGDNFVSHRCLIKLLVEKSLQEVSDMTWEEFVNIDQFRPENVHPRGQSQPRRVSREERVTETTPRASTSGANPSSNSPTTEQAIEIGSSESEYSSEESSSSKSDVNPLPKTPI